MSESHMHLHFLSLLLLYCVSSSSSEYFYNDPVIGLVACRPHQIQAFTKFKNEFDTRHCNHSDSFNGVWCDNFTGAVTKLQLRACLSGTLKPNSSLFRFYQLRILELSHNNFISSSLSYEFGNLNKLEVLSLHSNGFLGQIPSSFNNLSMLAYLDLYNNKLTGSFPFVRNLTNLSLLSLSCNHLTGTLNPKSSLFKLHHLRYLDLGYNDFSSLVPSEFGNLNKLEVFTLSSNGFLGPFPPTISNLTLLTDLYLDQNKLSGNLPLVQNLTKLSTLELLDNHFSGNIPSSLFTMPFLSYLDLQGNSLNGSIEVPNSSSLEKLNLGHNYFDDQILEPISKLLNLTKLDLSFLNLSYPIDLGLFSSLKSLSELGLSGNNLSPESLRSDSDIFPKLEFLHLSGCDIIEFPNMIKTFQNLLGLDLSENRIKGKVPQWLWNLPQLSILVISNNLFNGFEGPPEILVNSSLNAFALNENFFEGAIPSLPLSINMCHAESNRFTGSIPLSICDCKSLTQLSLSYNNLTGSIPQCLSNLTVIDLRKNNLEGSVPNMFYVSASLLKLDVGYNRLTGKLPRSLLNCSSLQFLNVEHNRIRDTFPLWLETLPNLQVLTLRSNKFHGLVSPHGHGPLGFPALRIFELSDNNFSGSLPPSYFDNWKASSHKMYEDGDLYMEDTHTPYSRDIFNEQVYYIINFLIDLQYKGLSMKQAKILTSYIAIDFSGNRIEGQIPESIGLLKTLIALNLSNNAFTGHIPSSFANFTELESLDLSRNQLSGTIPNGLGTLSFLAYMNVSHNNLTGEIPQGTQITGQPKSSFEGNTGLCGLPLDESCLGSHSPPTQQPEQEANEEEEEEQVLNWKAVVIGYEAGILFGLVFAQLIASYKPEWLAKIIGPSKRMSN